MDITTITLIIFTTAIVVFAIVFIVALILASKNIFSGSGSPVDMANVLFQSIMAAGQIIVGLAFLAIITVLIVAKDISTEVGLPIITAITAYLVGKNFNNRIIIK